MRLLLDTSAYSAFMRGHAEIRVAVQSNEEIFLNSVILGELIAGFIKGGRRRKNENELRRFLASPRVGVLNVTRRWPKDMRLFSIFSGVPAHLYRQTISGLRPALWSTAFAW